MSPSPIEFPIVNVPAGINTIPTGIIALAAAVAMFAAVAPPTVATTVAPCVPVTSPARFPVNEPADPVTLPVTFPISGPLNVPLVVPPRVRFEPSESVVIPPSATVPPPVKPVPAVTVSDEFVSCELPSAPVRFAVESDPQTDFPEPSAVSTIPDDAAPLSTAVPLTKAQNDFPVPSAVKAWPAGASVVLLAALLNFASDGLYLITLRALTSGAGSACGSASSARKVQARNETKTIAASRRMANLRVREKGWKSR